MSESIIVVGAGKAIQFEDKAAEAGIYPGHLVEESAAGSVLRNNVDGGESPLLIAIENTLNAGDKTTVYANGDTVYYRALIPGMVVQVRLAAAATAVVFGDHLELDGDGGVEKISAGTAKLVAREAVDNSGGATDAFIKALVI